MSECSICCEKFNRSTHRPVNCKTCASKETLACQSCAKRYILDQPTDASCMVCKVEWDQDFLCESFTKTFISKELKVHRENYLLEKQMALLPDTQHYAEQLKLLEGLSKQKELLLIKKRKAEQALKEINHNIKILDNTIRDIRRGETQKEEKGEFKFKCPVENCNGFLNEKFHCGICENKICRHCMEIKNEDHECDSEKKATVELLKKDTKPCPKCGQLINKSHGCFSKDTPILMWNGTIKMSQDIINGDILIGDDGEKRTVINTVTGLDTMYLVQQNDGEDYVVNSKHKLTLYYSANGEIIYSNTLNKYIIYWFNYDTYKLTKKNFETYEEALKFKNELNITDKLIDIPIESYIKLTHSSKNILKGIKLEKSVEWEYKDVSLDPYILGLWLGDGYSNGKEFCTNDSEILTCWKEWCKKNEAVIIDRNDKFRYYIKNINNCTNSKYNAFNNPLKEKLSNYNLINNKHIPNEYLINSKDIRLQLLAGIIDTDGCVQNDGRRITIITIYDTLAKNIEFLANSLGYSVHVSIRKRINVKCPNAEPKDYKDQYNINISGNNIDEIPTILSRKKCKKQIGGVNLNTTAIKVTKLEKAQYYGWEVSGNNRFILKDFTITHNCDQMYCIKCHTAFSWRTGAIERGNVHNPEYYRWMRENGQDIPRNPLDVREDPCGNNMVDYMTLLNTLRYYYPARDTGTTGRFGRNITLDKPWTVKMINMHRLVYHINAENRNYENNTRYTDTNLRELRAQYILGKINKDDFKKKIQMMNKKQNKEKKLNDIWNLLKFVLIEYIGKVTERRYEMEEGQEIIKNIVTEATKIQKFCNDSFKKVGKMYTMIYPGINIDWIHINNWESYLKQKERERLDAEKKKREPTVIQIE